MKKRSHSEFATGTLPSSGDGVASKKLKIPDALSLLSLDQRLATLSQTLLPVWKALGKAARTPSEPTFDEGSTNDEGNRGNALVPTANVANGNTTTGNYSTAVSLTRWDVADIPKSFPPLPSVLDPTYERAALTHAGVGYDRGTLNYERLEWIGDAYLYIISSGFIWQTFQSLPPGKCAQLREALVRNTTLCEYSVQYGLDRRATFTEEFNQGGRRNGTSASAETRTKVLGDLFEAYTAAIILSDPVNGLARASEWLKALWSKTIASEIVKESRRQHYSATVNLPALGQAARDPKTAKDAEPLPDLETAKTRLATAIAVRGVTVRYKDVDTDKQKKDKLTGLPLYTVEAVLDGWGETHKRLGSGTGQSKKEAGQKAAQRALENKALMKVYMDKKARFLAAREAQQVEAGLIQPNPETGQGGAP
ncbi:Ribonuclease III [Pleurostoma richardsiae]|uniref:Ribonuclease III n=1 Tax=Pleurostoma richardsiae TaxID=41990 RepID=A0AA38VSP2_9PEZI|nr:Ribonuclease III [Pleurostoma richardsiae]